MLGIKHFPLRQSRYHIRKNPISDRTLPDAKPKYVSFGHHALAQGFIVHVMSLASCLPVIGLFIRSEGTFVKRHLAILSRPTCNGKQRSCR